MNRKDFIKSIGAAAGAPALALAAGCGGAGGEDAAGGKGNPSFLQLAKSRYSVRYYAKKPVEQEKIDAILEAARVAPTAKNLQPFKIYVLRSAEAISKINKLTRCAYGAPVVFLVCHDRSKAWTSPFDANDNSAVMDVSIVGTHMMLEATEQGLGSCWVKYFNPKKVSAAFGVPGNLEPSFILDAGYPLKGAAPNKMHFERRAVKDFAEYR
ncbi:MAG: nitroreductase family protein [Kiritimatiellae bacterium]|nr:nitroreductase family protein [Kiritimatiellia bacterium]